MNINILLNVIKSKTIGYSIKFFAYVESSNNIVTFFFEGLFKGREKVKFLLAFVLSTLVILVFLRIIIELIFGIYALCHLRRVDPEGYKNFVGYKAHITYKKWLKGEYNPEDVYCRLYHKYEKAGNICLLIWMTFIVLVTTAVLISYIL